VRHVHVVRPTVTVEFLRELDDRIGQAHTHRDVAGVRNACGGPSLAQDHVRQAVDLHHAAGPPAAADPIRWGILSTGNVARKFVADLRRLPDAAMMAVGSRTRAAAERFASEFAIPRAYGGWAELAADPEVDVVYVATPISAHYAATLTCIEAGKAVLTEKPFALDLRQARTMIDTARDARVFLMEAMWTRLFPATLEAVRRVEEGAIGDVVAVHADFGIAGDFAPTHRLRARELGGGALLDLGVYPLTLAHLFLGPPSTVLAHAAMSPEGIDTNTGVVMGYPSGAVAVLGCSILGDQPRTASVTGTAGRLEVHRSFLCPTGFSLYRDGAAPEHVRMPYNGWGYHFEALEVHRCIRAGRIESDLIPHEDTLAVMATLEAARDRVGTRHV
jgi:predicted dehydrogenase